MSGKDDSVTRGGDGGELDHGPGGGRAGGASVGVHRLANIFLEAVDLGNQLACGECGHRVSLPGALPGTSSTRGPSSNGG